MSTSSTDANFDQLQAIGGNLWESGSGIRRAYFNDVAYLFGLQCTTYKTGNVCSATLDGAPISNSHAKKILADLQGVKLWVDLATGEIEVKRQFRALLDYDYAAALRAALLERIAAIKAQA